MTKQLQVRIAHFLPNGKRASAEPFHPQGFGQHGSSDHQIDYPSYGHLGKKVTFESLPVNVQRFVLTEYRDLWDLNPKLAQEAA